MGAEVRLAEPGLTIVQLDRRTYSPVLHQADLPPTVPWWCGRRVR